jgi:hypothetical protein
MLVDPGDVVSGTTSKASDTVESLILDFIEWVARRERTYQEALDAWRTSCPRLTIWEDAQERRLVACEVSHGRTLVRPTRAGFTLLKERRRESYNQLPQRER